MKQLAPLTLLLLGLAPALAYADKPASQADDKGLDCHFEGDADRNFLIDDRGGIGEAYDFEIQVGGGAGNHSFCPHCRLALFATDLGVDVDELIHLSALPEAITSIEGLVLAIDDAIHRAQQLIAAIEAGEVIEGLETLKANFKAGDVVALGKTLGGVVSELTEKKARLENLGDLAKKALSGAFSPDGLDV